MLILRLSLSAVMAELLRAGILPHPDAKTVNGKTMSENCSGKITWDPRVIKTVEKPVMENAGFLHLRGNLFDSAIMKSKRQISPEIKEISANFLLFCLPASVISTNFRERFLSDPNDPMAFEGPVRVWHGPEEYHDTIEETPTKVTDRTILVMLGAGPIGESSYLSWSDVEISG
jgi:dihydroxy-acid dehydratase